MFSALTVVLAICGYMTLLFGIAQWTERTRAGRRLASHPAVFALGLAVYCTTWTYYGSVGKAAAGGMGFLPVYLGPTLALLVGGTVFERIAKLKHVHRVTSVADFISARYARSQAVAALVTALLAVGVVPYIALQMKAVTATFAMITAGAPSGPIELWFGPIVVVLMIAFTIIFGIRHLDPTERHPGMVVSLATESIVKVVAFLASGAFVVGAAFGSFWKFSGSLDKLGSALPLLGKASPNDVLTYVTVTFLSMAAFVFLPRQFHVGVIENSEPKHVRTAQWLMPLYLIAINVYVVPMAFGGKLLAAAGTPADYYVLALPLQAGKSGLSLAVFVGGFSAAIGMIMIESMTMATMISNHLVMPLAQRIPVLHGLRRRMLPVRWVAAAAFIVAGYQFALRIGGSYPLVAIGLISFAAAFVLAPVVLGGLYWKQANRAGALFGISAGFGVWFYTLLLPTFVKAGWLHESMLSTGPFHIAALRPEALFGLAGLPALAHGVIWTMSATVSFFVFGSVAFTTSRQESLLAEAFLDDASDQLARIDGTNLTIDTSDTLAKATALLSTYLPESETNAIVQRALGDVGGAGKEKLSVVQFTELYTQIERALSGAIGAASAYGGMKQLGTIDRKDKRSLEREFARTLVELKLSPRELKTRIDFQKEREQLLDEQFHVLQGKIAERDRQIVERTKAEEALQRAHDELEMRVVDRTKALAARERSMRLILDSTGDGLLAVGLDGSILGERSKSVEDHFGALGAGRVLLWDYLSPHDPKLHGLLDACFQLLAEDVLPFEVSAAQMPSRMERGMRSYEFDYKQVFEDGMFARVLMIVRDVTDRIAGEKAETDAREQQIVVSHLLRDRKGFGAFVQESERLLTQLHSEGDRTTVLRALHTLKGNSAIFGFTTVAAMCHAVEDRMNEDERHAVSDEDYVQLSASFRLRLRGIEEFLSVASHDRLDIGEQEHARLVEGIKSRQDYNELLAMVETWRWDRTSDHLGRLRAQALRVADAMGKKVDVRIVHNFLRLPPGRFDAFWAALVHVVRNAVDHGIEAPDERVAAGKTEEGSLRLETRLADDGSLVVEVGEDGRGVDVVALRGAAARRAIPARTEQDVLQAMFADGVTTREAVTEVSGRGVGLAAVRFECQRAGGEVSVQSQKGRGATFTFRFPRSSPSRPPKARPAMRSEAPTA